jgi:hypothetical protein
MSTEMIRTRSPEYVEGASVRRNAHMNRWRGDDPTPEQSAALVAELLTEAGEIPTVAGVGAFSDHLVAAAGRVLRRASDQPRELRVAVLVDFINWAAGRFFCADLALYTCDLPSHA